MLTAAARFFDLFDLAGIVRGRKFESREAPVTKSAIRTGAASFGHRGVVVLYLSRRRARGQATAVTAACLGSGSACARMASAREML